MRAGTLRDAIYIERRGVSGDDGYGNVVEDWARFSPPTGNLAANIIAIRGNEQLIAARTTGVVMYEIKVRYSSLTVGINAGDRVVNARTGETYNIKASIDPEGRKRRIVLTCETGGPDG